MKKPLIITALLLASISSSAQKLTINKTTIDVGKTGYEVPVTATFELRNKSSKPMVIEQLKTECGCTIVDGPKSIPPGES